MLDFPTAEAGESASRSRVARGDVGGPGEPLRLGVAGCGRVFEHYHLPALRAGADWRLVAACDRQPARRAWLARRCDAVPLFESLTALLDACSLDAVLVASSPAGHAPLAIEALQRHLPVLVEKPMALDVAEASSMLRAAHTAQRQAWIGFNRRFCRPYLELRDRLAAVPPESLRALRCEFLSGSGERQSVAPHWGDEAQGGGILEDIASHQIDLLPWLIGRPVIEARARHGAPGGRGAACVWYQLRFDTGVVADCHACHTPVFRESIAAKLADRTLWADTVGMLESRWLPSAVMRAGYEVRAVSSSAMRKLVGARSDIALAFERQLRAFAAAVRDGNTSPQAADAVSGVRGMQIIEACRDSRDSGGRWLPVRSPVEPSA